MNLNIIWLAGTPYADLETWGGLGIINTKLMNVCLLVKWIWKIYQGSQSMWYKLIRAKYIPDGDLFSSKNKRGSQFWSGLNKVKHLFKWGAIHKVRSGEQTSFWSDVWLDVPLRVAYHELYSKCSDRHIKVSECITEGLLGIDFRRNLTALENEQWHQRSSKLENLELVEGEDTVSSPSTSSRFSSFEDR